MPAKGLSVAEIRNPVAAVQTQPRRLPTSVPTTHYRLRSFQFGRMSAPTMPRFVQTMRGPGAKGCGVGPLVS
jgi:hypothetical protein